MLLWGMTFIQYRNTLRREESSDEPSSSESDSMMAFLVELLFFGGPTRSSSSSSDSSTTARFIGIAACRRIIQSTWSVQITHISSSISARNATNASLRLQSITRVTTAESTHGLRGRVLLFDDITIARQWVGRGRLRSNSGDRRWSLRRRRYR